MTREIVHDSEPQLRNGRKFLRTLVEDGRTVAELSSRLFIQNLRARRRNSLLGYLWLLITPLAIAGVWIFLYRSRVVSFGAPEVPYPVYVVSGVFLWQAFLRMLNSPLQQLNSSRPVLTKLRFPWEALLLAAWAEALLELGVYLVVLAAVLIAYGISPLGIVVSLPVIVMLMLLGAAIGLILTPFGLLYEDIPRMMGVFTLLLFFLTPIVYPLPQTRLALVAFAGNPVAVLLVTARELLTGTGVSHPLPAVVATVIALLLFAIGLCLFRVARPHLVSRL